MRSWIMISVLSAACSSGSQAPAATEQTPIANRAPEPRAEPIMASPNKRWLSKMRGFTDDMCECKDAACAQHVMDRMRKLDEEEKLDRAAGKAGPPELSGDEAREADALTTRMGGCLHAVIDGSSAPSP